MQAISQTIGVGERAVGAGLTGAVYSGLVERRGITPSLIEGGVVMAADAIGQGFAHLIPIGSTSNYDIPGSIATGLVYSVGSRLIGYQNPFNGIIGNTLYGMGCDLVGQTLSRGTTELIAASSTSVHHSSHHSSHSGV